MLRENNKPVILVEEIKVPCSTHFQSPSDLLTKVYFALPVHSNHQNHKRWYPFDKIKKKNKTKLPAAFLFKNNSSIVQQTFQEPVRAIYLLLKVCFSQKHSFKWSSFKSPHLNDLRYTVFRCNFIWKIGRGVFSIVKKKKAFRHERVMKIMDSALMFELRRGWARWCTTVERDPALRGPERSAAHRNFPFHSSYAKKKKKSSP